MFLGTKHDLREWARSCPLTLALFPNTENVLGEMEQMVRLVTQGAASGSCRFTNVQYPDSRFRGHDQSAQSSAMVLTAVFACVCQR